MIHVVAKNLIKADKIEEFKKIAVQLVKDTNEFDAGCIKYELYQDISNPQIFTFIEDWDDRAALDNHMAAKHFKEASKAFEVYKEQPGDVGLYHKLA